MPPSNPVPPQPNPTPPTGSGPNLTDIGGSTTRYSPAELSALKAFAAMGPAFASMAQSLRTLPKDLETFREEMQRLKETQEKHANATTSISEAITKERNLKRELYETERKLKQEEAKDVKDRNVVLHDSLVAERDRLANLNEIAKKERKQRADRFRAAQEEIKQLEQSTQTREREIKGRVAAAEALRATASNAEAFNNAMQASNRIVERANEIAEIGRQNAEEHEQHQKTQRLEDIARRKSLSQAEDDALVTSRKNRKQEKLLAEDAARDKIKTMAMNGKYLAGITDIVEASSGASVLFNEIIMNMKLTSEQAANVRKVLADVFVSGKELSDEQKKLLEGTGIEITKTKDGKIDVKAGNVIQQAIDPLVGQIEQLIRSEKAQAERDLIDKYMKETPGLSFEEARKAVLQSREFQIESMRIARKAEQYRETLESDAFKGLIEYLPLLDPKEASVAEKTLEEGASIPKWAQKMIGAYERSFGEFSRNFDGLMKVGGESTLLTKILVYSAGSIAFTLGFISAGISSLLTVVQGVAVSLGRFVGLTGRSKSVRIARVAAKRLARNFSTFGRAAKGVGRMGGGIATRFTSIVRGLTVVMDKIPLLGRVFGFVPKVLGSLGMFFKLGQVLFPPLFAIIQIITAIVGAFRGFGKDGLKGAIIGAIAQIISGLTFGLLKFEPIYKFLMDGLGGLLEVLINLGTMIWNFVIKPLFDMASAINDILGGEGGFFQKLIQVIIVIGEALLKQILGIVAIAIKFVFVDIWVAAWKLIKGLWQGVLDFWSWLTGEGTSDSMDIFFEKISSTFEKAVEGITDFMFELLRAMLGETAFEYFFPGMRLEMLKKAKMAEREEARERLRSEEGNKNSRVSRTLAAIGITNTATSEAAAIDRTLAEKTDAEIAREAAREIAAIDGPSIANAGTRGTPPLIFAPGGPPSNADIFLRATSPSLEMLQMGGVGDFDPTNLNNAQQTSRQKIQKDLRERVRLAAEERTRSAPPNRVQVNNSPTYILNGDSKNSGPHPDTAIVP